MNITTKLDPLTAVETMTLSLNDAADVRLNKDRFYDVMDGIANDLDDPDPERGEYQSIVITLVKRTNGVH